MPSRNFNGTYYAVVVSTDFVKKLGVIGVRIPELETGMVYDNTNRRVDSDYNLNQHPETKDQLSKCFWARILTAYGGVSREGILIVPPVGSRGAVTFLNNDKDCALWLGNVTGLHNFGDRVVNFIPASNFTNDVSSFENVGYQHNISSEQMHCLTRDLLKINNETQANSSSFLDTSNEIIVNIKGKDATDLDGDYPTKFFFRLSPAQNSLEIILGDYKNDTFTRISMDKGGILLEAGEAGETKGSVSLGTDGTYLTMGNQIMPGGGDGTLLGEGENDSLVKYSALSAVVELIKNHTHETSQGPTTTSQSLVNVNNELEKAKTKNISTM